MFLSVQYILSSTFYGIERLGTLLRSSDCYSISHSPILFAFLPFYFHTVKSVLRSTSSSIPLWESFLYLNIFSSMLPLIVTMHVGPFTTSD